MLQRERIIINFKLGKTKTMNTKREFAKLATTVVTNAAFEYADGKYWPIVNALRARIAKDVQREIDNAARIYRTGVIGAGPRLRGPVSSAQSITSFASGGPQGSTKPSSPWPARSKNYLRWKRTKGLPANWFQGEKGLMREQLGFGANWSAIFGGVKVDVRRKSGRGAGRLIPTYKMNPDRVVRVGIADVSVSALSDLPRGASESQVVGAVMGYDQELGYRVGGRKSHYRETLEPFVHFVIERAVPFAVAKRIQTGLSGRLSATGAGRV